MDASGWSTYMLARRYIYSTLLPHLRVYPLLWKNSDSGLCLGFAAFGCMQWFERWGLGSKVCKPWRKGVYQRCIEMLKLLHITLCVWQNVGITVNWTSYYQLIMWGIKPANNNNLHNTATATKTSHDKIETTALSHPLLLEAPVHKARRRHTKWKGWIIIVQTCELPEPTNNILRTISSVLNFPYFSLKLYNVSTWFGNHWWNNHSHSHH